MAKTDITPSVFTFQLNQVRTVVQPDGAVWFVGKDVCKALGIGWCGTALNGIPDAWQGMWFHHTPSGNQRLKFVSEPAVYKLAFRSNKPEADAFTNWVASEVLPAIRKTGKYEARPEQAALPMREQSNVRPSPEAAAHFIDGRCDRLRMAMGEAKDAYRSLWCIVNNCIDSANAARRFGTPRHALACVLSRTCHAAFDAWERDAQTIEQAVKAMRIVAVEME